jgi:hypothetical protein
VAVKLYTDFEGGRECIWTYHRLMKKTFDFREKLNNLYVRDVNENEEFVMPKSTNIHASLPKSVQIAQRRYRRACLKYLNALDKEFGKENPDFDAIEPLRLKEVEEWNRYNDAFNVWLRRN